MTHPDPTAAARALAAVLEQENTALAALDLPAATALLAAKEAALAAFVAAASPAAAPPTAPMTIPLTIPPGVAPLLRRVETLAGENRRLLARAIEVQSRVIALVARAGAPAPAAGGGAYRAQAGRLVPSRPLPCTLLARA